MHIRSISQPGVGSMASAAKCQVSYFESLFEGHFAERGTDLVKVDEA